MHEFFTNSDDLRRKLFSETGTFLHEPAGMHSRRF
jgi:hypothetical protein